MQMKPKKRLNPDLMGEAADMAAEQMQIPSVASQQAPPKVQEAPIVPTTNMRLPNIKQTPAFGGASGIPSGGMMGGFGVTNSNGSMNVTGGGEDRANRIKNDPRGGRSEIDYATDKIRKDLAGAVDENGNSIDGTGSDSSQAFDDLMNDLLSSGPRDTAAEEEQIRNQMLKDVSANQAGLNARIAAGGGGTSGALGALSTDMRSRAALDAANAITGVQSDARDEYLQKAKLGMDAEIGDRKADMSEAQFQMYMDMMEQLYGGDQPAPTEGASQRDRANSGDSSGSGKPPAASTTGPAVGSMPTNPIMTDEPPAGAQYTSTRNGVAIYVLDGKYYGVEE